MKPIRWIVKYANRKYYDKTDHKYVTLADIKTLVLARENIKVYDNKTVANITAQVLFEIITKQQVPNAFTIQELSQVIQRNAAMKFE